MTYECKKVLSKKVGDILDINRVKQILSSSAEIEVQYNGVSVWIDDIKEEDATVIVHLVGGMEEQTEVDIASLKEI
ncbi:MULTISPECIES: H-type small acid-soluble spore protein [Bacillaceae]|jgi:small acid-soluble spore protein H (minor)|uniref:H-type small acid-soluble spore protein n=1 Tax=Bacillaceae TaxID=186817 RepID=UPI0024779775|nr:Small, acid-soluble spore protein H [Bacillus sp. T2.9-1]